MIEYWVEVYPDLCIPVLLYVCVNTMNYSTVLLGSLALRGVGSIVFDVVDGVDDKGVMEGGSFKLPEAVSARKVPTETDVVGESGLFHKEENRVDGGIW